MTIDFSFPEIGENTTITCSKGAVERRVIKQKDKTSGDYCLIDIGGDLLRDRYNFPISKNQIFDLQEAYLIGHPLEHPGLIVRACHVQRFLDINGIPHFELAGPCHKGNSGGPVVDAEGRLIGMLVSGVTGLQDDFSNFQAAVAELAAKDNDADDQNGAQAKEILRNIRYLAEQMRRALSLDVGQATHCNFLYEQLRHD